MASAGRRRVGGGGAFFCGVGILFVAWPVGIPLIVIGGVIAAYTFDPVSNRLPTLDFQHGGRGDGFALRYNPPAGSAGRRLKGQVADLASDIHSYLKASSVPWIEEMAAGDAMSALRRAGASEDELRAQWSKQTQETTERYVRERQELAARFGGRIHHVLDEFVRMGWLDQGQVMRIEWYSQSKGWLAQAAVEMEALAERL